MSLRNGFSGQLRCWRGRSTAEPSHYRPSTGQCSHIGLTEYFSHVRLRMSQLAQGSVPACDAAGEIALLPSPWAPWKGAPLRVMLVTEKPLRGELSLTGPDGSVAATSRERHGGPPYFWFTEIKAPASGSWH